MAEDKYDFTGLKALFINCTLKKSPAVSNTDGLIQASARLMSKNGVKTEVIRPIDDDDIATGLSPDLREKGWKADSWPDKYQPKIMEADILVLAGPIWLGDNSSVMKQVIERLYGSSGETNKKGQYLYYDKVAGCLITGNEDGYKHCTMNVIYSLMRMGFTIPPQASTGWVGPAGPGPSYMDKGSGGPENDFTNEMTTFMTWNLMHFAKLLKDIGGVPPWGNQRDKWTAGERFGYEPVTAA